jgi:uncharacterized protein
VSPSDLKRCVVAYATPEQQYLWTVEVPSDGTIADALEAARRLASLESVPSNLIPWSTAPVGIFGEPRDRADRPADGDRIELYRPLHSDPRERRRERLKAARTASRGRSGNRP